MHVLLDLYGVLLDHEKMFRGYRERLAELLAARFGGAPEAWRRAHDEAWVTYLQRVNSVDWESRGYADIVDELDARHLLEIFDRVGVTRPPSDALAVSREFEREAMSRVNARYPDARTAIERLRSAGHRVYVATGGSETNDAALRGAGLFDLIDGIFTGHSQNAQKGQSRYWQEIPHQLGVSPRTVSSRMIGLTISRPRPPSESSRCCWIGKARTDRSRCRRTWKRPSVTSRDSRTGSNSGPRRDTIESRPAKEVARDASECTST